MGMVQSVRPFTVNSSVRVPLGAAAAMPAFSGETIDLEVGCGTGMFALDYAGRYSERHLIAIEQTVNKYGTFARAFAKQPLPNLTPVHADATLWIDRYVPSQSIDRLFILYPNPYPKAKQKNLRWHYMPAMHSILRALKPNAQLVFCTNMHWLVNEAAAQFVGGWGFNQESLQRISDGEREPLTLFEKKYLERGETCFDLRLRKPAKPRRL